MISSIKNTFKKKKNAKELFDLGNRYLNGDGVKQNNKKAIKLCQNAVKMGYVEGMVRLGYFYENGIGVEKNEKSAFEWYQKSADLKDTEGMNNLRRCFEYGIGVEKDEVKALEWNLKLYHLQWIPYNQFKKVEKIDQGGYSTVFKANKENEAVALKVIHHSNINVLDFIKELGAFCNIGYENPSFLRCYGISQDEITKNYILVLEYAEMGSLRSNLRAVSQMNWLEKLNLLYRIAYNLQIIHSRKLIHRDLHSGNILLFSLSNAYIGDLGLSISFNTKQIGKVHGVMPYMDPEVLLGQDFTASSDIYSFGIIMIEIATGQRPFDGREFDNELATKIYLGERPKFSFKPPRRYVDLVNGCVCPDPSCRPTIFMVTRIINEWIVALKTPLPQNDEYDIFDNITMTIQSEFFGNDYKIPIIEPKHPDHMYTSKIINTRQISETVQAQGSKKVE